MPQDRSRKLAGDPRTATVDSQILAHVARNRLTTVQVARKYQGNDLRPAAVAKLLRRLCRQERLNKYPLYGARAYFVLGRNAVREFGLPSGRCRPLGPQALSVEYAALKYITSCPTTRQRLTRGELSEMFPWLPRSLSSPAHCLDTSSSSEGRLELIRVDLGSRVDHLARKALRDAFQRKRFRQFDALTSAGRFRLVILTTTSIKAHAIRQSLQHRDWPRDLPVHISVIRELIPLIGGTPHAT